MSVTTLISGPRSNRDARLRELVRTAHAVAEWSVHKHRRLTQHATGRHPQLDTGMLTVTWTTFRNQARKTHHAERDDYIKALRRRFLPCGCGSLRRGR